MLTLYSGIPGSGKSYKLVAELSREKDKHYVVHNIDGLKEGYLGEYGVDFRVYCESNNISISEFFTKEYQIDFCNAIKEKYKRTVLVIIDEAAEWFGASNPARKIWIRYHRHLGQNIWMVAHRVTDISSSYRGNIEVEYRAKHNSFMNLPFYFFYNRILGGQRGGYCFERKSKEIFSLYKSAMIVHEKKKPIPKLAMFVLAVAVVGMSLFYYLPQHFLKHSKPPEKKTEVIAGSAAAENSTASRGSAPPTGGTDSPVAARLISGDGLSSSALAARFALVAVINDDRAIIEDRLTGEQMFLSTLGANLHVVDREGMDRITVFDGREIAVLTSLARYQRQGRAAAERHWSGAAALPQPGQSPTL